MQVRRCHDFLRLAPAALADPVHTVKSGRLKQVMLVLTAALILARQVSGQLTPSPTYTPPEAMQGLQSSSGEPNRQWANVLGNSLWFYDAQRSGRLDQGAYENRVEWRNDSALEDGQDWGVDLTGGFYDAGDYIKATFPLSFTLFCLAWGGLTQGRGYDLANQTAYLDGTLRWGLDWLIKAHPEDNVLFVQVGDPDIDSSYWGGDQGIPTPRPAYQVNSSFPGTDAFAAASAAFSIASMLYTPDVSYNITDTAGPPSDPTLANGTYAATLLEHARTSYEAAKSITPYTLYSESVPQAASAYGSFRYTDDLCYGALALALATNDSTYYRDAYEYYVNFSLTASHEVWNWDSKTPAVYVLFVEAAIARPGLALGAGLDVNLTGWRTEAEGYFDKILNDDKRRGFLTRGGLLYYNGDSDMASLNPALSAATLMLHYAPMASDQAKADQYIAFAQGQVDYLMGDNPMNAVYIVGMHPNSPKNPHSAPASGGNDIGNIRNDPPESAHVLYGAVVGGPLENDRFWDWRDDWVQTEIALDYNANLPALAAMQLINGTADPYYVQVQAGTYTVPSTPPCDAALPCGGLSDGQIAGIVIGVVLGVALIIAIICYWKRESIKAWWDKGYRGPKRG